MKKAIFAGSFDPITNGHVDLIERALNVVDELHVLIASNSSKKNLMSISQRLDCLKYCAGSDRVVVASWEGLIADYAIKHQVKLLVRGLRSQKDFANEYELAWMNEKLGVQSSVRLETIWIASAPQYSALSSSLVREVVANGGDVSSFVPAYVAKKFNGSNTI